MSSIKHTNERLAESLRYMAPDLLEAKQIAKLEAEALMQAAAILDETLVHTCGECGMCECQCCPTCAAPPGKSDPCCPACHPELRDNGVNDA